MTHVFDPNNTWMFKSFTPKFGPDSFQGRLPGTVTELTRPDYKIVGPGYYHRPEAPTTNLKMAHMRDNGIERGDYRCGSEVGRISEMARNPRLGPGLYKADESTNISNPVNWEGVGIMENTDVRFKPTPISDLDESINAEIEAGKAFRESPALAHDRKVWTQKRGPTLPAQRRGLLPPTPAPHMRRGVSCPPDPRFFLKKNSGMDACIGSKLQLEHTKKREKYHDEFFNAQDANNLGKQPKYPPELMPKDHKLKDWKEREAERMERECPQVLHRTRCPPWVREAPLSPEQLVVVNKTTLSQPYGSLARQMQEAGNIAKCAFESGVQRTVESVRSFCPHMTEMSKSDYTHIGPGCYAPANQLDTWADLPSGYVKDKGFGSGSRGLIMNTPRKPESYFAASKRKRNKNLSMFATSYLKKSHKIPAVPQMSRMTV